jgi:hypothetical protein
MVRDSDHDQRDRGKPQDRCHRTRVAGIRVAGARYAITPRRLVRNSSARFREHRLRIPYAPATKPALQDAGRRLLDVDRDQYQAVWVAQRDDGALDL